jgi:hypothetical protein
MSGANLIGGLIFGTVGFAAFLYGKKQAGPRAMVIGIVLMVFPYFISNTLLLYAIGGVLSVSLFIFRD